jgi:hypothetical protein
VSWLPSLLLLLLLRLLLVAINGLDGKSLTAWRAAALAAG